MGAEQKADLKLSEGFVPLRDRYLTNMMDVRMSKNPSPFPSKNGAPFTGGNRIEYRRSLSQSHGRRILSASYFSLESMLLLVCLTASLLLLPLMLPPLPPPPFMLLLIPICILSVLMILALMPSNARDATYKYV